MAELYNTDEALIRRFSYLSDCYGDTPAFCDALDTIQLSFDDRKRVIWRGIFEATKYAIYGMHDEAIAEYEKIEKLIEQDTLLHIFFLKEKLFVSLSSEKPDAKTINRRYDEVINQYKDHPDPHIQHQIAVLLSNEEYIMAEINGETEAIKVCDVLIEKFKNSANKNTQAFVAMTMNNKAIYLTKKGLEEDAISVLDTIIAKYEGENESRITKQVIRALHTKAVIDYDNNDLENALRKCEHITRVYNKKNDTAVFEELLFNVLVMQSVIYSDMYNETKEQAIYNDVFNIYKNSANTNIQRKVLEIVFIALLSMEKNCKYDELVKTADKAIKHFYNNNNVTVQMRLLEIMFEKARVLYAQGKLLEEINVYNDIIKKLKNRNIPPINEQVYRAMMEKVSSYERLGSVNEAIHTYNEAIDFLQKVNLQDEFEFFKLQAMKTDLLQKYGKSGYEENYRGIIEKYIMSNDVNIRKIIIRLMFNRAQYEGRRGKKAEKMQISREIINLFAEDIDAEIVEPLTKSMVILGKMLCKEKQWEEAMQIFLGTKKYKDYDNDDIQYYIATALNERIGVLETTGNKNEEINALEEFIAMFTQSGDGSIKEMVSVAERKLAEVKS